MGFSSTLKSIGNVITNTVTNPVSWFLPAAPFVAGYEAVNEIEAQQEAKFAKEQEAIQNQINEANQVFNDGLESNRTNNYQSNVIYAGVLGNDSSVGLGGVTSLLGL